MQHPRALVAALVLLTPLPAQELHAPDAPRAGRELVPLPPALRAEDPWQDVLVLLRAGEPDQALELLREIHREGLIRPPDRLLAIANVLRTRGRFTEMGELAREVHTRTESELERRRAAECWSQSLLLRGREREAAELLEGALASERSAVRRTLLRRALADVLLRLGEDVRALALLNANLSGARDAASSAMLCEHHAARGEWSEALRQAEAWRAGSEWDGAPDLHLARSLAALGDPRARDVCWAGYGHMSDEHGALAFEQAALAERVGELDALAEWLSSTRGQDRSSGLLASAIALLRAADAGDAETLLALWCDEPSVRDHPAARIARDLRVRDEVLACLRATPVAAAAAARAQLAGPHRPWAVAVLAALGEPDAAALALHDFDLVLRASDEGKSCDPTLPSYLLAVIGRPETHGRLRTMRAAETRLSIVAAVVLETVPLDGRPQLFSALELERCRVRALELAYPEEIQPRSPPRRSAPDER